MVSYVYNMSVIKIENLWKEYRLGVIGHGTLTQDLQSWWAKIKGREDPNRKIATLKRGQEGQIVGNRFWAIRDMNLEVRKGEILGIIGKNGAGKSTLLKIISRVTAPSRGSIKVKGRIASLLEVGTGFHPELTGRENIFMNGAILGMSKLEIKVKLDQIIDFSGIERFIDTPVKRYSSGMHVRLAFAVAAHLEPEILVVDEVLAVGDIEFQKKCLGKMDDVAKSGRTILFVSHNMAAIRNLCTKLILLENGSLLVEGETNEIIEEYLRDKRKMEQSVVSFDCVEEKPFQLLEVSLLDEKGIAKMSFDCDQSVSVKCKFLVRETVPGLYGYATISQLDGTVVFESDSFDTHPNILDNLPPGRSCFTLKVPPRTLSPGDYQIYLNFGSPNNLNGFNVDSPGVVGHFHLDDHRTRRGNRRIGYFSTGLVWQLPHNELLT